MTDDANTVNIAPIIEKVAVGAAGNVYTISPRLIGSRPPALAAGTHSNLSLTGASIIAAAPIAAGTSQTAIVQEVKGRELVQYAVVLTTAPQLTATPPVAEIFASIEKGAALVSIGNVPVGVEPVITPNGGRFVIGGDEAAGWTVNVGPAQFAAAPARISVSAPGAISLAFPVTVTDGPTVAPFLPAVTSGIAKIAVGARGIVSGYVGNIYRLIKSNGATYDVAIAAAGGIPDYTAVSAWIAGDTEVRCCAWYDQFTGVRQTQYTYGNSPSYDINQAHAGCVPIINDPSTFNPPASSAFIGLEMALAGTLNNLTIFDVLAASTSLQYNPHWSLFSSAGGNRSVLWAGTDVATRVGFNTSGGTASGASTLMPRAQISVLGVRCSATDTTLYNREQVLTGSGAQAATAFEKVWLGFRFEDNGYVLNYGRMRRWGFVAYTALSDADALAVRNALTSAFAIPTSFDRRLIIDGDSIPERFSSIKLKTLGYYMAQGGYIPARTEIFNLAIAGQTLGDINGAKAVRLPPLLTGGPAKIGYFNAGGINGLRVNESATKVAGDRDAIALYVKSANPAVRVGFQTILPQYGTAGNGATDAGVNTQRIGYNSGTVPGGNIDAVADAAGNATIGTYPSSPQNGTYFDGGIHPTDAAFQIMGPIDGAVVAALLT